MIPRQRIAAGQGGSTLRVEARHACFRMAHTRQSRAWIGMTDAGALGDLAQAHSLSFKGDSETAHPQLVQHQASDWDFAVMRARAAGQLLIAEADNALTMFRPEDAEASKESLTYGRDILSFELELNAERQPNKVETGACAPADQQMLFAEARPDIITTPGNLTGAKPAARLGDATAHGGAIIAGAPNLMIGG